MRTGTVSQPESGIAECGRARPAAISSSRSARQRDVGEGAALAGVVQVAELAAAELEHRAAEARLGTTSTPSQLPTSPTSASTTRFRSAPCLECLSSHAA